MTDLTDFPAPSWTDRIRTWFSAPGTQPPLGDGYESAAKAELIDKIANGYIVEETGKVAKIPRFAQDYLITCVKHGDA